METYLTSVIVRPVLSLEFAERCVNSIARQTRLCRDKAEGAVEVLLAGSGPLDAALLEICEKRLEGVPCRMAAPSGMKADTPDTTDAGEEPEPERSGADFCEDLNRALEQARGRYLQVLDPADVLAQTMLEEALSRLEGAADFLVCNASVREPDGLFRKLYEEEGEQLSQIPLLTYPVFLGNCLFRTELIREGGLQFQENSSWGDYLFLLDYLGRAKTFEWAPQVLACLESEPAGREEAVLDWDSMAERLLPLVRISQEEPADVNTNYAVITSVMGLMLGEFDRCEPGSHRGKDLFRQLQTLVKAFSGAELYHQWIADLFGINATVLELSTYESYMDYRRRMRPQAEAEKASTPQPLPEPEPVPPVVIRPLSTPEDVVMLFGTGSFGMRVIIRSAMAWLRYKRYGRSEGKQ